jgi:hypothetical protein
VKLDSIGVKTLQAQVCNGRLVLDQPTALPEGTVLDLVVADDEEQLDDEERAALESALDRSWGQARAKKTRPIEDILRKLKAAR